MDNFLTDDTSFKEREEIFIREVDNFTSEIFLNNFDIIRNNKIKNIKKEAKETGNKNETGIF